MANCKQCKSAFEITDGDRDYYKRLNVSEPKDCPRCRQQRRMAWANQMNLYKRKCDGTGEEIISHFAPDAPFPVYSQDHFSSDTHNGLKYGRDYDFNKPFFEQYAELLKTTPRPCLLKGKTEFDINSDYTNFAGYNQNCYMIFDSDYNENCYYSFSVNHSKVCVDNYRVKESELCFQCIDCVKCYGLKYSQDSDNCSESAFLKNCIGCRHCFMCSNLKDKEYYIYNQKYDKETFERLMNSLSSHSELAKYFKDWDTFKLKYPQKYIHGYQSENVTGDYLVHSKNAFECFDCMDLWDCKYCTRSFGSSKDCMDFDECGDKVELLYECAFSLGYGAHNCRFCAASITDLHDLTYCYYLFSCSDCFGCIGLHRNKYCILNKQYSEAEYKEMVPKIIEHMKSTGEWGQFFPIALSDFAYNESVAQEYYPLTKEEALAKGYKWRDRDKKEYLPATMSVPDNSQNADASILGGLFACEKCGRNYKIVEQELAFYKNQKVVLPKQCFYCRHKNRFNLRNKRVLYKRKCAKTGEDILTTYSSKEPWIVYGERAYLDSLQ